MALGPLCIVLPRAPQDRPCLQPQERGIAAPELHCSLYLNILKFVFLKFQKNVKLFPGMHIHIPNTRCKFRYKSRFVLDYRKKQNSDSIQKKKGAISVRNFSFCSQNTKYFFSRFLPVLRNMCTYSHICFKIFLSIESVFFKKFKYQEQ